MLRTVFSTRPTSIPPTILKSQATLPLRSPPRKPIHASTQPYTLTHTKNLTTTPAMADDTSYSTFLSKANEDPSSGTRKDQPSESTSQARSRYDPSSPSESLPASLRNLPDTPYVSDTDSDWEVVFFNYASDEAPSLDAFKDVLKATKGYGEHGAEGWKVEELKLKDFDPRDQYAEVVERVKKAGEEVGQGVRGNLKEGEEGVKVFRVEVSRTRVEYYVLTVGERKLMGVVAKAVES